MDITNIINSNHIDGLLAYTLALSVVDHMIEHRSGQTIEY